MLHIVQGPTLYGVLVLVRLATEVLEVPLPEHALVRAFAPSGQTHGLTQRNARVRPRIGEAEGKASCSGDGPTRVTVGAAGGSVPCWLWS